MTVCGALMVKDEAEVVERCLLSLMPLCDHILVMDTGSTDGTTEIVERVLHNFPHTLRLRLFTTYGDTRTALVQEASTLGDWVLMIDAHCTVSGTFTPPAEDKLLIQFIERDGDEEMMSRRALILRSSIPWRYDGGELHEYVTSDAVHTEAFYNAIEQEHHGPCGQRRDTEDDLSVLQELAEAQPKNPRWMFYVAQTLKALERTEEAIEAYYVCVQMGQPEQEWVWYSLFQAALLRDDVHALIAACELRPERAEGPYAISVHFSNAGRYDLALPFAEAAARLPEPDDTMFINRPVYAWAGLLQYSICLAANGHFSAAEAVNAEILARKIPDAVGAQVKAMAASYPHPVP